MPFKKGKSGNEEGRPKGKKNRKTEQWEVFSEYMLNGGLEKFQKELDKLEGKEFVTAVKDLMEYFKPKLSRVDTTIKDDSRVVVEINLQDDDKV